ncbi:hypothetical protein ACS0TY_021424 [Phlomoides rotata]
MFTKIPLSYISKGLYNVNNNPHSSSPLSRQTAIATFQANETIAIPSNTHPESGLLKVSEGRFRRLPTRIGILKEAFVDSQIESGPMDELPDVAYPGTKRALIKRYRLGWSMGDEQDLVDCLESQLLGREITSPKLYMRFLGDVWFELRRFGYDFRAVRNKVESLANLYAQFKLFVFKTPGVKYNFLTNKSIVEVNYWSYICEHFGREGAAQALCRLGKFEFYQQAYYIFDVNGVEMYVIDGPPMVRRGIPVGINLHGQLMNRYVSYYRNPGGMNDFFHMHVHSPLGGARGSKRKCGYKYSMIEGMPNQIRELNRLTRGNHYDCLDNLRVDRNAFGRLCTILRNHGGLVDGKHVSIEEQVSMFLGILAHHKKNRVVRYTYNRSDQNVSHYVHLVLTAILQLHSILLVRPEPVPDDSTNHHWKWFKCHSCQLLTPTCNAEDLRMAANDRPLPSRGSFKKPTTNTRRIWTTREEKVLIDVLKELVNKGYKSDNGFRTGYLIKCEEALKADFPKTDLQASPHITSKLTAWRKNYSSLVTAHTTTGVGFNTTTSQLECTDDQWESVVKTNPFMRGMRYKE